MPTYSLHDIASARGKIDKLSDAAAHIEDYLDRIVDINILPILARNYDRSGLRRGPKSVLYNAITVRGARGNVIVRSSNAVRVGVDKGQVPEAEWAIRGRGPVQARNKKSLHWMQGGRDVFAKRVRASPPHSIYYLNPGDLAQIEVTLYQLMSGKIK